MYFERSIFLLISTSRVISYALPNDITSPALEKRVYACPSGTLVCCHITKLEKLQTAQGCKLPVIILRVLLAWIWNACAALVSIVL